LLVLDTPSAGPIAWLASACFALVSCGASSETQGTVMRDSSGVTIVENGDSAPAWSVQNQLTIGVTSGDVPYQLDRVRDATRLPDGRIVVVNGGSADLRFFGTDGTHLETVGRSGSAPGEFRAPSSVHRRGDTLLVWDFPRIALLTTSGEVIGTEGLERMRFVMTLQDHGMPFGVERLADGSFMMRVVPDSEPRPAGEYRPEIGLVWMSADLAQSHFIGQFPDIRHVNVGTAAQPMSMAVPMSAHVLYAAGGDPMRVYISWSDSLEVLQYSTDGRLLRSIRGTHAPVPVSEDALSEVYEQRRALLTQSLPEGEVERRLNLIPNPETYPALDALDVDERGWIWARHYLTASDSTTRFSIFDTTGALRGEVEIPSRFEPLEVTVDYVLGVSRGEVDVERVRLYAIVR